MSENEDDSDDLNQHRFSSDEADNEQTKTLHVPKSKKMQQVAERTKRLSKTEKKRRKGQEEEDECLSAGEMDEKDIKDA